MLTDEEKRYLDVERALHESYLASDNPRRQSGFGRDQNDWKRFRHAVVAPVMKDGSYLDIGCANGLLMESVVPWALEAGHRLEPYGLDISPELATVAKQRLFQWRDRIFVGNALDWTAPMHFDFVRTELVYVPPTRRREYVERLLERVVAPSGRLIVCSYGSSRLEGARAERLADEIAGWGMPIAGVHDTVSEQHDFVVTHVVSMPR